MQFTVVLLAVSLFPMIFLPTVRGLGCPNIPAVKDFKVKDFVGTWYQQASNKGALIFQVLGSCAKAEYNLDEETNIVNIHNSQKSPFGEQNVKGTAVLADEKSGEGKLTVTLDTIFGKKNADLLVLATDYENFAILYSCKSFIVPLKSSWIFTRKQKLEGDEKTVIDKKIDEAFGQINQNKDTLKRTDYITTSQNNC